MLHSVSRLDHLEKLCLMKLGRLPHHQILNPSHDYALMYVFDCSCLQVLDMATHNWEQL